MILIRCVHKEMLAEEPDFRLQICGGAETRSHEEKNQAPR
jgi:hypothetical protein